MKTLSRDEAETRAAACARRIIAMGCRDLKAAAQWDDDLLVDQVFGPGDLRLRVLEWLLESFDERVLETLVFANAKREFKIASSQVADDRAGRVLVAATVLGLLGPGEAEIIRGSNDIRERHLTFLEELADLVEVALLHGAAYTERNANADLSKMSRSLHDASAFSATAAATGVADLESRHMNATDIDPRRAVGLDDVVGDYCQLVDRVTASFDMGDLFNPSCTLFTKGVAYASLSRPQKAVAGALGELGGEQRRFIMESKTRLDTLGKVLKKARAELRRLDERLSTLKHDHAFQDVCALGDQSPQMRAALDAFASSVSRFNATFRNDMSVWIGKQRRPPATATAGGKASKGGGGHTPQQQRRRQQQQQQQQQEQDVAGALGRRAHDVFELAGDLNTTLDALHTVRDSYDNILSSMRTGILPLLDADALAEDTGGGLGAEMSGTTEMLEETARVLERSITRARQAAVGASA